MASKKFKVDRKALAAVAGTVLHPTPRLAAEKAVDKGASGSGPRDKERESSLKRKTVEAPPPPSPKKSKAGGSKGDPSGVEQRAGPTGKESAPAAGKASSGSSAFPARPMSLVATGAPTVLEGSGSSGAAGRELAVVPSVYPKPQGPNGDCCIAFRSFKGWFPEDHGAKGYPTECFKTFNLPQDAKHFEKRSLGSVSDEFLAALGVVNVLGVQVMKMNKNLSGDAVELKKKNDHLLERDAQREGIAKELSVTFKKEGEINAGLKSRVKTLEEELDVIRESSRIQEKEKEEARARESQSAERAKAAEAKLAAAEARVAAVELEMAKMKASPSVEVQKLVVDQYQNSDEFKTILAEAAFPEWETGWNSCQRFLAEGGVAIPEGLSSKDFWMKHPEGYPDEEEAEGGDAAGGGGGAGGVEGVRGGGAAEGPSGQ